MSAAQPLDRSGTSTNTPPDLSIASLTSFAFTPGRPGLRAPSTSTAQSSAPITTPSPPSNNTNGLSGAFSRRKAGDLGSISLSTRLTTMMSHQDDDPEDEADVLGTPGPEKKRWGETAAPETPVVANRAKRTKGNGPGGGVTLTLRDQEKHIDSLKKENFNIKLRVHFLEEQLARLAPDQIDAALKQNINLKIEVQQRGMEMKKLKKLVLSLEHELERLQRSDSNRNRERELEDKLEEREHELRELRRRKSGNSSMDNNALRDAEARNEELEDELHNTRALLEENMDEIDRLKEIVERESSLSSSSAAGGSETRLERLKRRVDNLEVENENLQSKLQDHIDLLAQRDDENSDLADLISSLRLDLEEVQLRREAESVERSESRAQIWEEREEREAVEDDLNALRDRLAAVMIELQQKEDEVEVKAKEIDDLVAEHQRIVEVVEDEWRGEVDEARGQVEELKDVLAEREAESKDLRVNISELEANTDLLHSKFEAAFAHLEAEADENEAKMEGMQETIDQLGEQIYHLEDDNDRLKEEGERMREEETAERERLEALSAALKEKISTLKEELKHMTEMYETCSQDIHAHRSRQEELAQHVEELVSQLQSERSAREQAETDLDAADNEHDTNLRKQQRILEGKESALQSALADLARTQSLLSQRETDLEAVQQALKNLEAERKRLGETHTTARFSLQLETDRMKRDMERLESELARARQDLSDKDVKSREHDSSLDKLHAENRDLQTQLGVQTQARLNVSEKLDLVLANLKGKEEEVGALKKRVNELEGRLEKDQRMLLGQESQYRDQVTERNTLLLTIYQYLDKILGVDKTPKKSGQAETKPFTNFGVFHDNLITRLKALSQIQMDFDKRCKEIEARFTEKVGDMRKQLDNRWKQIDKFETSLKTYADTKVAWKRKLSQKEGELEAMKVTNAEMATQLSNIKRPGGTDVMELRSLTTRATNAERRLNNAQNQLLTTEEKLANLNQKTVAADGKWEARVKEYEARLKAAEERVKRERQGSKERVAELENSVKNLQRQLELAQKRNNQLNDVMEVNKVAGTSSPVR
ncbi:hypothetical protein BYT27DRAFT_7339311 [Phlegmacium glaucopus]|nr:hypothetical protein BYT27DRAFT_7339311 [Phlegmacium glaucopus]